MQRVAIVGLGRFGMAVIEQLASTRAQVIAIDTSPDAVADVKDLVDVAVVLDATDERALRGQDVHKCDYLVVAIGENFEAALLTAVLAKKLGIPNVIVRATTSMHAQIFRKIGADEVIQPESEAGIALARRLANPSLEDFVDLGEGYTLIELRAPSAFRGKTLRELNLRAKYGVNLVAIRRSLPVAEGSDAEETRKMIGVPQPDEVIEAQDILMVIGANENLGKLPHE